MRGTGTTIQIVLRLTQDIYVHFKKLLYLAMCYSIGVQFWLASERFEVQYVVDCSMIDTICTHNDCSIFCVLFYLTRLNRVYINIMIGASPH